MSELAKVTVGELLAGLEGVGPSTPFEVMDEYGEVEWDLTVYWGWGDADGKADLARMEVVSNG